MKMSKYFKNFILCGDVDHYCLLCQEIFQSTAEVEKHVRWEQHRKNIKNQTCMSRFKIDSIFKIGKYYYCEVCNYVTQDITIIQDHVNEDEHKTKKTNPGAITKVRQTIGQYESGSVKINDIVVNKLDWHGIIKNQCIICNIAVENINKHIAMGDHLIRLIQTHTKFENGSKLYRKINEDTFQCFTCKKTIATMSINDHLSNKEHGKTNKVEKQVNGEGEIKESHSDKYDLEINSLTTIRFFKIDVKSKTATCKACNHLLAFKFIDMKDHIKKMHMKMMQNPKSLKDFLDDNDFKNTSDEVVFMPIEDHGLQRSELSKYGKENMITLNAGGSKGYCTMCDKYLSANINVFKQHIYGAHHTGHLELKGLYKNRSHEKGTYKTDSLTRFLKNTLYSPDMKGFWINADFCIDYDSFIFIKVVENGHHYKKIKCHACDEMIPMGRGKDHCKTTQHKTNVMAAEVVLDEEEFIREIRPNLYHCGFCNLTFPYWERLNKHRKSLNHQITRNNKSIMASVAEFWHYNNYSPDPKNAIQITRSSNNDIFYLQLMKAIFTNA